MDSDQGKLFIGGITWETSEETLKEHFNKYGEVVETVIMRDKSTGNARGFGFVLYSDPSVADKALQDKHVILGRIVEVKKAVPRGEQNQNHQQSKGLSRNSNSTTSSTKNCNQFRTKKIFVGGLPSSLTEEDFKAYFEKFGRITDVVVMFDSVTRRPRGFGFITFDSEDAVENVMQKNFHELNDKLVEVKRAVPKDGNNINNINNNNNNNNFNNHSSPDVKIEDVRGSVFGTYPGGIYPPISPRCGYYHGYAPSPVSGYGGAGGYAYGGVSYGMGYPMGGYGGYGYGPQIVGPRSLWNGPGMVGARCSPVPYGNAAFYPGFFNNGVSGFMGTTVRGGSYHGIVGDGNGKWNQGGGDAQTPSGCMLDTTSPQVEGGKLNGGDSDHADSYETGDSKQNRKGPDEQFTPYPNLVG